MSASSCASGARYGSIPTRMLPDTYCASVRDAGGSIGEAAPAGAPPLEFV